MPLGVGWSGGAAEVLVYDPSEIERKTLGSAEAIAAGLRRRHPQLSCVAHAALGPPREASAWPALNSPSGSASGPAGDAIGELDALARLLRTRGPGASVLVACIATVAKRMRWRPIS